MRVFIVIPCYNEAERLAAVIESVKPYGQVVVVDDGSKDNSAAIAKAAGVHLLRHILNRGQGAALETGNLFAAMRLAQAVVHFDADGQHQATDLPALLAPLENYQADVVFGSRFLNKENVKQVPWLKKWLILKPAIVAQNYFLKTKLTDVHNGLRAFSARALKMIRINQDGMAHPSEIIEQVMKYDLRYQEVPVTVVYHEFGQGFKSGLKILSDLFFGKVNKQ